jgi:hypothetical protein
VRRTDQLVKTHTWSHCANYLRGKEIALPYWDTMVMSVGFRPFETYEHALMDMKKCITSVAYAQGCQTYKTFMLS